MTTNEKDAGARVAAYAEAIYTDAATRWGTGILDSTDAMTEYELNAAAVMAVADAELAALRDEVERLRSWLPRRIVEQPLLFGTAGEPRHEVGFTEEMRTYCTTCSAQHQDWVTPDECPQFAEMDVPSRVAPAVRAEAAEAEVARLRRELAGEVQARRVDMLADIEEGLDASDALIEALSRAEAAEARLRAVEALADELEGGESERTVQEWLDDLRAALASVPSGGVAPTEQAGEYVVDVPNDAPPRIPDRCTCGAPEAYSLNPAEVVTHRTDGPCTIGPAATPTAEAGESGE